MFLFLFSEKEMDVKWNTDTVSFQLFLMLAKKAAPLISNSNNAVPSNNSVCIAVSSRGIQKSSLMQVFAQGAFMSAMLLQKM